MKSGGTVGHFLPPPSQQCFHIGLSATNYYRYIEPLIDPIKEHIIKKLMFDYAANQDKVPTIYIVPELVSKAEVTACVRRNNLSRFQSCNIYPQNSYVFREIAFLLLKLLIEIFLKLQALIPTDRELLLQLYIHMLYKKQL